MPLEIPVGEEEDLRVLSSDVKVENLSVSDKLGPGLRNDPGEYNCCLNMIVQVSLSFKKIPFLFSQITFHFLPPWSLML